MLKLFLKIPLAGWQKFINLLIDSLQARERGLNQLYKSFGFSIISVFIGGLSAYAVTSAFAIPVSYFTVVFFYSLAVILIIVPVTVAGIGLREGGLAYLLVQAGGDPEKSLAASLISLAVLIAIAIVGGLIELRRHFFKRVPNP